MVHRLMAGLGAAGVERVVMMPAASGVSQSLQRHLSGRTGPLAAQRLPALEVLEMRLREDARDSAAAVAAMAERRVAAIVVLGGDGTHRVVARHCGDIPLCALSTGTNNAFPELREATVAGLATGLVAAGRLGGDGLVRRAQQLEVAVGAGAVRDSALGRVARPVAGRGRVGGAGDLRQPQRGRPVRGRRGGRAGAAGGAVRAAPATGPGRAGAEGGDRPARPRPDRRGRGGGGPAGAPGRGGGAGRPGRLPGPGRGAGDRAAPERPRHRPAGPGAAGHRRRRGHGGRRRARDPQPGHQKEGRR